MARKAESRVQFCSWQAAKLMGLYAIFKCHFRQEFMVMALVRNYLPHVENNLDLCH